MASGKKPDAGPEWQMRGVPTAAEVAGWAARPAANMGLLLGPHPRLGEDRSVVALDMDVWDAAASVAVLSRVREAAPKAPLRKGDPAKPGTVFVVVEHPGHGHLCLQQGDAFRFADTPDGKVERVEVLGQGRQSVIHGTHPSGAPFTWEGDRSILDCPVYSLPVLTLDELSALIVTCNGAIEAAGGERCGRGARQMRAAEAPAQADLTPLPKRFAEELLAGLKLTNNDLDRPTWVNFSKAVKWLCEEAAGDRAINEALGEFHERYEGTVDPDDLRRVLGEEEPPARFGLAQVLRTMHSAGWAGAASFGARVEFASAPAVNDNDMPGATDEVPRPVLLQDADVAAVLDGLEASVIARALPLYQRGTLVSVVLERYRDRRGREVSGSALRSITVANLIEFASRHFDVRRPGRKGAEVPAMLSHQAAAAYLDRGQWRVPTIGALVQAPALARSGRIVAAPGFDAESGIYVADALSGFVAPDPTTWGSKADARRAARAALDLIAALFSHYRFATPADRSVALAALLTPFAVHAGVRGPLFAFNGTGPGVGKSKLVDAIAMLLTGARAQSMTQGVSAAEFEKHLHGKVLEGAPLLNIDNIEQPLEGDTLNAVLTQERLSIRPLGTSRTVTVEHRMTLYATGNNLVVRGDMARRVLTCRIDPGVERPELLTFPFDPSERASSERAALVGAALTVLAAHAAHGFPGVRLLGSAYGSFEEWSRYIRAALVWLGEADPLDVTAGLREADPVLTRLAAVLDAVAGAVGLDAPFGARDLLPGAAGGDFDAPADASTGAPRQGVVAALHEALTEERIGRGVVNAAGVGRYLGKHEGRVVIGLRLDRARSDAKRGHLYRVSRVADGGGSGG